jgi:energy-coupling factor transporter ATP-binding protein EcfA2
MKLLKIGLINWANIPIGEYEFDGRLNLITGHSAAGKTTILDAIQTVMTAAYSGLYQYNPGQDEAKQQSKTKESRSLASYVLGCDDGRYARPHGAHCHLIAVFRPDKSNEWSESVTAVISVSARLDRSGTKVTAKDEGDFYAVIKGHELSCDQFLEAANGRDVVVAPDRIREHFKKHYPSVQYQLCSGKGDYLAHFYGALQGKELCNANEAKNSARQLSKFMAYRKMDSGLDDFVREEVLEADDMKENIQEVSRIMKTIHEMERQAQHISAATDDLETMQNAASSLVKLHVREGLSRYEKLKRKELATQNEYLDNSRNRDDNKKKKRVAETQAEDHKNQANQLNETLIDLKAKAQGIDVYQQKTALETQLTEAEVALGETTVKLVQANDLRHQQRQMAENGLQVLSQPHHCAPDDDVESWRTLFETAITSDSWANRELIEWLNQADASTMTDEKPILEKIDAAYQNITAHLRDVRPAIEKKHYKIQSNKGDTDTNILELKTEISNLENAGQITLPGYVKQALKLIESELPEAEASILCDHIDVKDDDWQVAIEGFLGNNRFNILVDQEYEREAIDLLKRIKNSTSVVQARKSIKDMKGKTPPSDSIVNLLTFSHPVAEAYVKGAFSNVIMVDDTQTLSRTARGLMKTRQCSGGYKMFVVNMSEEDLVFGQNARERALKAKKERLVDFNGVQSELDKEFRATSFWHKSCDQSRSPGLLSRIETLESTHTKIDRLRKKLASLDLTDIEELRKEIEQTKEQQAKASEKNVAESNNAAVLGNDIARLDRVINHLQKQKEVDGEAVETEEEGLRGMCSYWPSIEIDSELEVIDEAASRKQDALHHYDTPHHRRVSAPARLLTDASQSFNIKGVRQCTLDISAYNSITTDEDDISSISKEFVILTDICRQIDVLLKQFKNDILAKHKDKLKKMSRSFQDIFVNDICFKMTNSIRGGKDRLDMLNRRLEHIRFGDERYKFTSVMVPRYNDFYQFFNEVTEKDFNEDLLDDGVLSERGMNIFERIQDLLISDDINKAVDELNRITDYRNYRSYDIIKIVDGHEISLKNYGTGSGAQLETPSYVIKSAALSSALKFDQQPQSLRMVMIDESFAKLDEQRSKAVINYLSRDLQLQVIFVVPNTKASIYYDQVQLRYDVSKSPSPEPIGELNTRVFVHKAWMKEEAVSELYDREKTQIRNKADQIDFSSFSGELDFLEELESNETNE